MAIFFTADTHFSKVDIKGVLERDFRPFKNLRQMEQRIIKIWNRQAGKNDIIYHLGDFVNYNHRDRESYKSCFKLVKKIKAKVILILGNNEQRLMEEVFDNSFEDFKKYLLDVGFYDVIQDGIYMDISGTKFYLNHRPSKHKDDAINLFGHIHNSSFIKRYGFNVGIDNVHFKLFSEEMIQEMLDRRKFFDDEVYN